MKQLTHVKTFDRGRWVPVKVPHQIDLPRSPKSAITGTQYIYAAGVSARELKFSDGSVYHADWGWK